MKFGEQWTNEVITRAKLEKIMIEICEDTPFYYRSVGSLPILESVDNKVEAWHQYLDRDFDE